MKYFFYISVLLCFTACKLTEKISDTNPNNTELFVDELAQMYTVASNNTIIKYDQDAKQLFEYSDNTLGPVTNFDVSNPLQLLAYYKNFQTVKIFDRTLTLNSTIDLNKLELFEVQAVASSNDNRIWVFDELNQELLKIDKNGVVQGRNNDLRLRLSTNATPYKMIEFQNLVYLFDQTHGLLIFNNFGEFVTQRPFKHGKSFSYWEGSLYYSMEGGLKMYGLADGTEEVLPLTDDLKGADVIYYLGDRMIYQEGDKLAVKFLPK